MSTKELKQIPRPEYPRPQFVRPDWINLNGIWDFEFDFSKSGMEREMFKAGTYSKQILVPFCPESKLSGITYKDFIPAVWYRRQFDIPKDWASSRIILHFGAVDYYTEVWINGQNAGTHRGGYSSFHFDITKLIKDGTNEIVVYAEDDTRSGSQPLGKQSSGYASSGCCYTRTTGIWQTVWIERVPNEYILSAKYIPDFENGCLHIEAICEGDTNGLAVKAKASFHGRDAGFCEAFVSGNLAKLTLALTEIQPWEPGNPNLYDLEITLNKASACIDHVQSYFGLRSIYIGDKKIYINKKPVFQRLVLDQGFYPDGIYTAPTDEDLKSDIEISIGLGFNGARLHEKIFEPRFHYWADRLGYIVWGEHANWGVDFSKPASADRFISEWMEAVERDFNHPSVVGWCPFNETAWTIANRDREIISNTFKATKQYDPTRPVIDTSGWVHSGSTDIFDVHDYDQNPKTFEARYKTLETGENIFICAPELGVKYEGQPYFISEYGGIWWNPGQTDSKAWGYGNRPGNAEEFIERYEGLTSAILKNKYICAFCYTQLYDIEQEVNGLYTYDRKPKFDPSIIKKINTQKAEIEE